MNHAENARTRAGRRGGWWTAWGLLALLLAGCATSRETMSIEVLSANVVTVQGDTVNVEQLPARMKKLGASPKTRIEVRLHAEAPPSSVTQVSRSLSAGGFRNFFFTKPRTASSQAAGTPLPSTPVRSLRPE